MTMDFLSVSGELINFSRIGWLAVSQLALKNGWKPLGTLRPEDWPEDDWDAGDYFSNVGQRVQAVDAFELANALERAIPNLPEVPRTDYQTPNFTDPSEFLKAIIDQRKREKLDGNQDVGLTIHKGWENKLQDFISLCKSGEFLIF